MIERVSEKLTFFFCDLLRYKVKKHIIELYIVII